jgi:D-alanyl-D-alanine carboxypeptidase/D-alanyl-D-alanine-endopeptidase (penicillin-binding protein 4)
MPASESGFSKKLMVPQDQMLKTPALLSIAVLLLVVFSGCSSTRTVSAKKNSPRFENDSLLHNAHVGISIYDAGSKKFLYQYQSDKYFVPASNIKIVSCYAGMKYLDSLIDGMRYIDLDTAILLLPTGDPTFLHPDFAEQPVVKFLQLEKRPVYIDESLWMSEPFGQGWSWDDYNDYYMPERSALPAFGNVIRWFQSVSKKENPQNPSDTIDRFIYSDPEINWRVQFSGSGKSGPFSVKRNQYDNGFTISEGGWTDASLDVPYITSGINTALELIRDTVHHQIIKVEDNPMRGALNGKPVNTIKTQHTDSLLQLMMHRSDNFFAEQILLMAALKRTGKLDDIQMIGQLLGDDLKSFPQSPRWVDGSGLSRYNLFSPDDFVWLLEKMKNEFGMERIEGVFPSGGMGTLKSFSSDLHNRIIAKSGSMSGVLALSGFLKGKSGKPIIFSILINNFRSSPALLRKRMEQYLMELIEQN